MSTPQTQRSSQELEQCLLSVLASYGPTAVALSAGVDSSVVAAAAYRALGDQAVAVTAVSPSLPRGEREAAIKLAELIGLRHMEVNTREMERADYTQNPTNRCYFCKTELYETILSHGPTLGVKVIANGANLDDRGDHRPGMIAAREFQVRSPLIEAGMNKADVRRLAQHWNLPNWEKPAGPCLSSRLAYGVEVTAERLRRVDAAENWLKDTLGIAELRVRVEANDLARIEVPLAELARLSAPDIRETLVAEFRRLGFRFITLDLEGFRSGSLNSIVPLTHWAK